MATTPAVSKKSAPSRRTFGRSLLIWSGSFLAIPAAGYLGTFIVGRVDNLGSALIGGALLGAMLGFIQPLVSGGRLPRLAWTLATTVGISLGVAAGTVAIGYRTSLADLTVGGLITGVTLGVAQALALPFGARFRWSWALLTAVLWPLAWVITTVAGITVGEQFIVFGSSGAIVYTVLAGVILHLILPAGQSETSPEPVTSDQSLRLQPASYRWDGGVEVRNPSGRGDQA